MKSSRPKLTGVRALTSSAVASSVLFSGCSSAVYSGTAPMHPVVPQAIDQDIVAGYGSSEQELEKVVSDAKAAGKVARFVSVTNGSNVHVFPPSAVFARTEVALIVVPMATPMFGRCVRLRLLIADRDRSRFQRFQLSALPKLIKS